VTFEGAEPGQSPPTECLDLEPTKANAYYNKAYELFELKRYETVPLLCKLAVKHHPGFSWAANLGARAHAAMEQHDEALAGFDIALGIDPSDGSALNHKAQLLQKLKRYGEALVAFDQALGLAAKSTTLLASKAECLEEAGQPAEAASVWQRWLMFVPSADPQAQVVRSKLASLARHGQAAGVPLAEGGAHIPAGAATAFAGKEKAPPVAATLSAPEAMKKALFCQNQGQHERAVEWFDACLATDAAIAGALVGKGESLRLLKRHAEALPCFEQALERNPGHATTLLKMGVCLESLQRFEDALAAFDKVIDEDPKSIAGWNSRGLTLSKLGRTKEALGAFEQALAVDPRSALPRFNLAELLDQGGRAEDAAKAYQQFLGVASPALLSGQVQRARKRIAELRGSPP
jgi:tetratricopeptide (TPR) repeat protein